LNEFAALSFDGIKRLLGLFSLNPQETYRRKDTLKFSRALVGILQTQFIDEQKRPTGLNFFPTQDFGDLCVAKVFSSTQDVKSENFKQGERREE